jgi:hypothetical protein
MHFCCYMNAEASLYKKIQCYVIYFSIYLREVWKKSIWFGQHCFFLHVIQSQLVEKETEFQYPKDSFCPESTEIAVHSWFSCLE